MKRIILMSLLLTILVSTAKANPVDVSRARYIGAKFLYANTVLKTDNPSEIQLITTYHTANNTDAFYVFNADKGYVIVAADDCATPILAYSDMNTFDPESLPIQMAEYLQDFVDEIQYGIENRVVADETTMKQWALVSMTGQLNEDKETTAVSPLISAVWGQGCNYNTYCPSDPNGNCGHALVGCVAIAMGQIMHFWGYPITGNGSYSYSPQGYPQQTANFGATTYGWSMMPNSLDGASSNQINAVATLLWHCGVSVDMMYGATASGAYSESVPYSLTNYFKYSNDLEGIYRDSYSHAEWISKIKSSLDLGRPVYYSGSDTNGAGGHAFVCDGYDASGLFHFNWGWYGNLNDYFAVGALNVSNYQFNYYNYAIINIHPNCDPGTTFQVTATASPSEGGTVSGGGSFGCDELCTLTAVPSDGYSFCSWTENGILVSTEPTFSFSVVENRNLVANFYESSGDACTLVFTLNDSYGDGWNGNYLTVHYDMGCYSSEQMTLEEGSSTTITRTVIDGSHVILGWIQGSYISECSFTVSYGNGVVIYQGTHLIGSSYEFEVVCDGSYHNIIATANPAAGGNVSGDGLYFEGSICSLSAVPNLGYRFLNWSLATGEVVSINPTFSFTVTESASYVANFSSLGGDLGNTVYDWQSNCGARTWTHVWPDGKVNFAFTQATNIDYSNRGTGIGTYDATTNTWMPSEGRVENEKTGFGSMARYGTNGIVVASHTATECGIYIIPDKDNYTPGTVVRAGTLDATKDPTWPNVMTSGANRTIIHVVASGYSDNKIYYYRSQNGGQTWDKQNVILPYMTTEYCENFNSNSCYWMETTDDNCLALVVNNAWSDGMVLYSYDNGETWERKVFYSHPGPHNDIGSDNMFFYPRWTSCQWDSQHHLHVLYEFMASTGEVGSGSFYPGLGGVAYWNETMPYNINGNTQSAIPGNLIPGQPFVMDSAYLRNDIYASWWLWSDASHEMWPEYVGYLTTLDDNGQWEDPYTAEYFNIEDRTAHGSYNSGVCGFPVLCMVPGTDEMVAVWSAMDENHFDGSGKYYYKLFARYSSNGGMTWSPMIHLTSDAAWNSSEFVYNQAAVVGRKLIIASQVDGMTGTYVQSDDNDPYDNYYQGLVFDIDELFNTAPVPQFTITVTASPANMGSVTGGGSYYQGAFCTLTATPNTGIAFSHWSKNGNTVSTNPVFSFIVSEDATYVAHFTDQAFTITAVANPTDGGTVSGAGTFLEGSICTLSASANMGYSFDNWTLADGAVVSTTPTFSFTVTESASYVANFSSIGGDLGNTVYDWQSNCGARTWTHVWPDGKVNFAFTQAANIDYSDRGTGIGTYDATTNTWIPSEGRVENEKTGFGSMARYGTNGIVVASHTATECGIYIIPDKDNYTPGTIARAGTLDATKDPTWPSVMTSGANRDIIHVVASGYSDNMIYYYRSQDGGATWDKQNVILPFMTTEYCENFDSNSCYWMETTDDNCLALVVNNAWSDGMVLYSYDDGETWERKVFYSHPNPHGDFTGGWYFYPHWTSCQWDSQHHLHVLYEFNGRTGEPGSGSFYPGLGGVAYWNETMPYNINGNTQSAISGNLIPGQPFVMDSAYLYHDIYSSWWLWSDASHGMWPEYVGYLTTLDDNGQWEDPYTAVNFNIEDRTAHGSYNSGVCGFPVLCMVPGTDEMVAVWSAMDENHVDEGGNYYYKLFASYSGNGGLSWTTMIHLTSDAAWNSSEFVYNQAAVVGRKLIIASQRDGKTGTYVQSDDSNPYDNHYQGFVFNIDEIFDTTPTPQYTITVTADPDDLGVVSGGGTYYSGNNCTLTATPNEGVDFTNWTKDDEVVSTSSSFSFNVTESAEYVAHFTMQSFSVSVNANPDEGGVVNGAGTYTYGSTATVSVTPNQNYVFLNWTENGTEVSTEATFSFEVTEDHQLTANLDMVSDVDQWEEGDASIYPNPVKDKLTVELTEPIRKCEVYSFDGSLMYIATSNNSDNKLEIDVKHFASGTYLIRLTTENAVMTRRFVKQ